MTTNVTKTDQGGYPANQCYAKSTLQLLAGMADVSCCRCSKRWQIREFKKNLSDHKHTSVQKR